MAELIEEIRCIAGDAPRQDLALPCSGRDFIALQLPDYLQQTIDAMQLCAAGDVLPSGEEAEKVCGSDRFDFSAQPAQRHPMNARENAAVAPLLSRPGIEAAAQDLTFTFDFGQRDLNQIFRDSQLLRELRDGDRAARFEPAAEDELD